MSPVPGIVALPPSPGASLMILSLDAMRCPQLPLALLGLALLSVGSLGCPRGQGPITTHLPLVATDDPVAEDDMRLAREAAEDGDLEEAASRYRRFLAEHPTDPLVPIAKLGLGQVELRSGDADAAAALFAEVAGHDDASVAERGALYQGIALEAGGHDAEALETLLPMRARLVDPAERALLLRSLANAAERLGLPEAAIEALDALASGSMSGRERALTEERLLRLISSQLDGEALARLYAALPHEGAAWPAVATGLLREAYGAGEMPQVMAIAASLEARDVQLDAELEAMVERAERAGRADPRAIGAILPLSGRGREVGQLALRGLMLAASARSGRGSETTQVVYRDSGGDPARAAAAVDQLVAEHRVVAIVGPVDGAAARSAAARAQALGVPMITLTPGADVTSVGSMIFRLFYSPEGEARELVRAARARGARRFAILYPDHGYGQTMRAAFIREVEASGSQLVADVSYEAGANTFREQVQTLHEAGEIDALLLPDTTRQVSLIAPTLASRGLWNAPPTPGQRGRAAPFSLLLPSVAFDARVLRSTGRYLQGALVSQPFHAESAVGEAREFVSDFEERYASTPDAFAAYAFDAARLIREGVDSGAVRRASLAERLRFSRGASTAGPSEGFGEDRRPAQGTRILEVRGDSLVSR